MTIAHRSLPARVEPPERPLSTLRYLTTVVRNPLKVWPAAIYREPIVEERFLGRRALFVMDPDLVREVLVDEAGQFVKPELMQRLLAPAVGSGILTSDGALWRRQRRIAAPLFRPAEIARYVPDMLAVAQREATRLASLPDGAPIALADEMMRTTFAVIAETILPGADRFDVPKLADAITTYLGTSGWVIALSPASSRSGGAAASIATTWCRRWSTRTTPRPAKRSPTSRSSTTSSPSSPPATRRRRSR